MLRQFVEPLWFAADGLGFPLLFSKVNRSPEFEAPSDINTTSGQDHTEVITSFMTSN